MDKGIDGIVGVILEVLLKALFDHSRMRLNHEHAVKLNSDQGEENVKTLLIEMLNLT
ncbi:MAG: hypothetical protein Hals2KO_26360 [Halioglobus sp.]